MMDFTIRCISNSLRKLNLTGIVAPEVVGAGEVPGSVELSADVTNVSFSANVDRPESVKRTKRLSTSKIQMNEIT